MVAEGGEHPLNLMVLALADHHRDAASAEYFSLSAFANSAVTEDDARFKGGDDAVVRFAVEGRDIALLHMLFR